MDLVADEQIIFDGYQRKKVKLDTVDIDSKQNKVSDICQSLIAVIPSVFAVWYSNQRKKIRKQEGTNGELHRINDKNAANLINKVARRLRILKNKPLLFEADERTKLVRTVNEH
jgi:predicted solute-binding protein